MIAAESEWFRCMALAGYEFRSLGDGYAEILREIDRILGITYGSEASEVDLRSAIAAPGTAGQLTLLLDQEIAVAVQDAQCSKALMFAEHEVFAEFDKE